MLVLSFGTGWRMLCIGFNGLDVGCCEALYSLSLKSKLEVWNWNCVMLIIMHLGFMIDEFDAIL